MSNRVSTKMGDRVRGYTVSDT